LSIEKRNLTQAERLPQYLCLVLLDTASWTRLMTQTVQPLPFVCVRDHEIYVVLLVDAGYPSVLGFYPFQLPPLVLLASTNVSMASFCRQDVVITGRKDSRSASSAKLVKYLGMLVATAAVNALFLIIRSQWWCALCLPHCAGGGPLHSYS